jgi:hypothetical protein
MSRLDELRRVADLVGIQTRHVDALGVWHEPGEETLAALISALRAARSAAAPTGSPQGSRRDFGLSPVQIVAQGRRIRRWRYVTARYNSVEWHRRFRTARNPRAQRRLSASLPAPLPFGCHRLPGDRRGDGAIELIVAPPRVIAASAAARQPRLG